MDKIQVLLDKAIVRAFDTLENAATASEKEEAIGTLTELHKLRIEELKIEREKENETSQAKVHSLDRWIGVGVQVGLAIMPLLAYNAWYNRGLRFEETGSIGSPMTRNLVSRMLPRK